MLFIIVKDDRLKNIYTKKKQNKLYFQIPKNIVWLYYKHIFGSHQYVFKERRKRNHLFLLEKIQLNLVQVHIFPSKTSASRKLKELLRRGRWMWRRDCITTQIIRKSGILHFSFYLCPLSRKRKTNLKIQVLCIIRTTNKFDRQCCPELYKGV